MYDFYKHVIVLQEAEAKKEGNGWIGPVLKGLKRSSPTGLRITLRSVWFLTVGSVAYFGFKF